MPLYEYECPHHGGFDETRPFAQSSEPAPCPTCGAESARVISVPRFAGMDRGTRIAHERNERSAHAPHVCHSGCGHTHQARKPAVPAAKPELKAYTGPRPWVIEHA